MHDTRFNSLAELTKQLLRGGPLEIPGGGMKIQKKNSCKEKCLEKKFVQPLHQRKKIRASKQQSTNSLEKKFVQRLNALKKNPAETRD
jgi:hypothetical protein